MIKIKKLKSKEYYQKNKEKIKLKSKEYRKNNKEKIKEYQENNKERKKKYMKKYQEKNKKKLKEYQEEYQEEYYQKNKEKIKLKSKIFQNWKLSLGCKLCPERENFELQQYNWIIEDGKYIDLHHQDPKERKFRIRSNTYTHALQKNKESIKEILKTIPLCRFCHRDVSSWSKDDERHKKLKKFRIKPEEMI